MSGSALPALCEEIADVIGQDAMRAVWRKASGIRVYIPAAVHADHWLVHAIGADLALKLCRHFRTTATGKGGRGETLVFPLFPKSPDSEARKLLKEASTNAAAQALGVTTRTIHRRRAKLRETRA